MQKKLPRIGTIRPRLRWAERRILEARQTPPNLPFVRGGKSPWIGSKDLQLSQANSSSPWQGEAGRGLQKRRHLPKLVGSIALTLLLCASLTLAAPAPAPALPAFLHDFIPVASRPTHSANSALSTAYHQHMSDLIVEGFGTVTRLLPDDNLGSRHQRFIVRLSPAHTVLVSHNIDLAPRIEDLRVGDEVRFKGEYEWSDQGGIVHWTHRDPRGNDHADGWIEVRGDRYD